MDKILYVLGGVFIGTFFGVLVMCMCAVSKKGGDD